MTSNIMFFSARPNARMTSGLHISGFYCWVVMSHSLKDLPILSLRSSGIVTAVTVLIGIAVDGKAQAGIVSIVTGFYL